MSGFRFSFLLFEIGIDKKQKDLLSDLGERRYLY